MAPNPSDLEGFIWNIADTLRGPYRPPQYRKVMLPMTVLRRLDCVLLDHKKDILDRHKELSARGLSAEAIEKILGNEAVDKKRTQPFYNTSEFTLETLLGDSEGLATNLVAYINGFSTNAREIFEKFEFEAQIEKLNESNRLYKIVQQFTEVDLHPDVVDNPRMGLIFENLVRKFNEQANEEAGDHFTPREVIRLMVDLVFTGEDDEEISKKEIVRTIYDPTCGTGGMLSIAEEHILKMNPDANPFLFGQEYNNESYAICSSDMMIKDEPTDRIVLGDTLGDGKTGDGHPNRKFHYMLANPPFGVKWEQQKDVVTKEHQDLGFKGRFGPGLPRINDGALLFLLHMISKMHPSPEEGGEGSKIAVVFNGSPLFTGGANSGESNIRRWIIENDWLDTVVALPNQLFYNTGIYTYIWLVTNRKPDARKGKIQLIDATSHYEKMQKSYGDKRNYITDQQIAEITRLYGNFTQDEECQVVLDKELKTKTCSKIFHNQDFGYLNMTVERPLRLNFQLTEERIGRLEDESAFKNLATSKKRKDSKERLKEIEAGEKLQEEIRAFLKKLSTDDQKLYMDRKEFLKMFNKKLKASGLEVDGAVKKAMISALSERDQNAEICTTSKGEPEPDTELRDTELVPMPQDIPLPLPIGYDKKASNRELLDLVHDHCEEYLKNEVLPHVPDAWIDHKKTKVGYEIPITRHFYEYVPPRELDTIEADITKVEGEILEMLQSLKMTE